jgi:hypothetical protein
MKPKKLSLILAIKKRRRRRTRKRICSVKQLKRENYQKKKKLRRAKAMENRLMH